MIVAVACDHAGRPLQERVAEAIGHTGHEPLVLTGGPVDPEDDYPDVARLSGEERHRRRLAKVAELEPSGR
jgi:ribose 5-phosphate isomerase RpiB